MNTDTRTLAGIAECVMKTPDNFDNLPEQERYKAERKLMHFVRRLSSTPQKTHPILNALWKATYNSDPRIVWRALDALRRHKHFTPAVCLNAGRMLHSNSDNAKQSAIDYLIGARDYRYTAAIFLLIGHPAACINEPAQEYISKANEAKRTRPI